MREGSQAVQVDDVLWWMLVGAASWPAVATAWRERGRTALTFVVLAAICVALSVVMAHSPSRWQALGQEDGPVEWATVHAFLAAAAWNAVRCWPRASGPRARLLVLGVLAFCVVVAGEEISWGQRLFAFQPPEAFLEHNFQQELNVHNVLMNERTLGFRLDSRHLVAVIALCFGVLGGVLRPRARWSVLSAVAPPPMFAPLFLVVVATELTYPVDLAGEAAEMMLGMLFLASALHVAPPPRSSVAVAVLLAPLLLGTATAAAVETALFGSDEDNAALARTELELLAADVERGVTVRLLKKKGAVHKRVFTAARDGYLTLSGGAFLERQRTPAEPGAGAAEVRRDRRGYFLDPWNNPYWILWDKKSRLKAALYSFGPNRKRDTDLRHARKPGGDDILVTLAPDQAAWGAQREEASNGLHQERAADPDATGDDGPDTRGPDVREPDTRDSTR